MRTHSTYDDPKFIGQKFGRLTVEEVVRRPDKTALFWKCRCDCGKETIVRPYKLIKGRTKSCGCYHRDYRIERNKVEKVKHGGRKERLYGIWSGMKVRCTCPHNKDYPGWGGKGVSVCDEWTNDYAKFRDWALNNGYKEGLTIDRIDPSGNYCPENCRWITIEAQQRNRRNAITIDWDGEKMKLSDWCEKYGVKYITANKAYHNGWDLHRYVSA